MKLEHLGKVMPIQTVWNQLGGDLNWLKSWLQVKEEDFLFWSAVISDVSTELLSSAAFCSCRMSQLRPVRC